ncbi:beta-lactamase/transpeptidase-like protein [Pholiota conissans]|uniref:Beta-lactamase/transpeptidase-like protein n=1 Tax=Pholiota conissans TaxID=109636 RepID=A0A9P5Z9Y6_9AGAR|nr:beta-lactamase/transpeptidase-like protein [Pholiota conissans]
MVQLTDSGKKALDDVVAKLAGEHKLPGFAIGATTADGEIYFNCAGNKVFGDAASAELNPDTVFWICSMTKLIAHIAALQLIEQGKLAVDAAVSDFFPQFADTIVLDDITSPNPSFKPATVVMKVKHLLDFTSGLFYPPIRDYGLKVPYAYAGAQLKAQEDPYSNFFSRIKGDLPGIPLSFEPGTNFMYGYGSDIIGFIVEKVTGKTLEEYLQENVFKPLGMKASFYLTQDLKEKLIALTLRTEDGQLHLWDNQPGTEIIEQDPSKLSLRLGGVGLYVSLRDYLKLLQHILQILDGKAAKPILKRETAESLFTGVLSGESTHTLDILVGTAFPGRHCQWSSGVAVAMDDWPKGRRKGSAFWAGWAGTQFFIDPATGVAAVFGVQIVTLVSGTDDPESLKGITAFEEALYSGLDGI